MDHDLAILSPEKTVLTYRLAGIGSRAGAHLLDLLVSVGGTLAIVLLLSLVGIVFRGLGMALAAFATFAVPILYFVLQEWLWHGQTLGKKAKGLRVRMEDGTPITFSGAFARNLLRPADFLPSFYFAGLVAIATNPKSQRIGDLVAKTIVVNEKHDAVLYAIAPHTAGIHPMEDHVGELRGLTLEEYDTLRRLCDRFPELTPETQRRLLNEIWDPIAQRLDISGPPNVHSLYLAEATVMKFGRRHGLL